MAIDIRATVTCSLGTLISGSISDDYLQGSGLIKTRGSVEISGTITPAIGTVVTFSYVKGGVTRSIPRKLRVMSSFADPFRRTTKVELGCKLTYLSDLKDPIDWSAFSDPENAGYTADDAAIITLPIFASSVMNKCLTQLGILASSNPLTNRFSIPEFDFSPGYVQVLSDLLVSESYFGYLNTDEVLQIRSLNASGGSGPVFTSADIVDLGPIGVGQLPGEAVTVSYSSLVLKAPTEDDPGIEAPVTEEEIQAQETLNWESTETVGSPQQYIVTYKSNNDPDVLRTKEYTGTSSSVTTTSYETLKIKKTDIDESQGIDTQLVVIGLIESLPPAAQTEFETNPTGVLEEYWPDAEPYEYVGDGSDKWIFKGSGWEKQVLFPSEQDLYIQKDVVKSRITEESGPLISIASSVAKDYLTFTGSFNNPTITISRTVETYNYDKAGNQTSTTSSTYRTKVEIASGVSVSWADETGSITYSTDLILSEVTQTTNDIFEDYTQEATSTSIKQAFTQSGQQAVAKAVEEADNLADMSNIISNVLNSGLVISNTTVTTSRRGVTMSQERPAAAARTNRKYTEESPAADPNNGFRTESSSSLVLAVGSAAAQRRIELSMPYAPDDFFVGSSGGPYYSVPSDARIKAMTFGRTQNRLLLGNRNGMNLQLSPERIPTAPFDPLYVQASGLTAIYRANGTSWAFDSNGIVASIDALFWAAVGGTGTFWFPVAPGITTLPAEPPIVDGQMNANTVVLPYNETALYDSRIHLITTVTKFAYSLELLTVVPATVIRAFTEAVKVTPIHMPAPAAFTLAAAAPRIEPSTDVRVTTTPAITIAAKVPEVGSGIGLVIAPPATNIALVAPAPAFAIGSAVSVLLHMDGTNGSTTFTDSSLNALTVTGSGNAQISTAQSKFGGASALLDGTGDYLSTANTSLLEFGGNDFTVEMWINTTQNRQYATLITRGNATFTGGAWTLLINNSSATAGDVAVYCAAYSTSAALLTTTGANIRDGAWHHIAWVRSGTNHYIFVDGTQRASRTGTSFTIPTLTATTYIGYDANFTPRDFSGYIDDLRVTNGVAWYTANFTAPTAAFPNP